MRSDPTEFLPVLGRGKHRSPKRGACFMEMASVLAGERWSDHPACTHPLLAHLARLVNDFTSDAGRQRLTPLIPSVIGLQSADRRWDHEIALLVATRALPFASALRRPTVAVGILACERLLAQAEGRTPDALRPSSERALAHDPAAAGWAQEFTRQLGSDHATRHPGPAILEYSVPAIAHSRGADADDILFTLLSDAITLCERFTSRAERATAEVQPVERPAQLAVALPG
ncbi:hypothetical protein FE374_10130 [Georgenia yuyongxinii]|uniref:Uncharacterized protein n=1 Tax=Georgenia yuyongxinii TaxID=2589797 RepID=A0A5B8C4D2_9MICO|nr:hypothetical protein [Georgenia yuyongxinii]QDC24920.1 hypothetical protein FE374_10130 [Georgenia yuyongxinii]